MIVVRPSASAFSTSMKQALDSSLLMALRLRPGAVFYMQQQQSSGEMQFIMGRIGSEWELGVELSRGVQRAEMGLEVCQVSQVITLMQELTISVTAWSSSSLLGEFLRFSGRSGLDQGGLSSYATYSSSRSLLLKRWWLLELSLPLYLRGTLKASKGLGFSIQAGLLISKGRLLDFCFL